MRKNHYRFLVKSEDIKNRLFESYDLSIINQIKNVFKLNIGSQISVFDGLGSEYIVEIIKIGKNLVQGRVLSTKKMIKKESKIGLFCSLLKSDHFEIILEKCTELGIDFFQLVVFDRSIVRELKLGKLERYRKIIKESAEQSGRLYLPDIFEPISFTQAVRKTKNSFNLFAVIGANKNILDIKFKNKNINIFVGPEGDFSQQEIDFAKKEGFLFFNLGDNILRSETAAIISCGIVAQFVL